MPLRFTMGGNIESMLWSSWLRTKGKQYNYWQSQWSWSNEYYFSSFILLILGEWLELQYKLEFVLIKIVSVRQNLTSSINYRSIAIENKSHRMGLFVPNTNNQVSVKKVCKVVHKMHNAYQDILNHFKFAPCPSIISCFP